MKKTVIILSLVFFFPACAAHSFRSEFAFANDLAKKGLWKEAEYRWKKSVISGDKSAAVHNNLAVSYEFEGKLKEAMEEYKKALSILPENRYILANIKKLKIRMDQRSEKNKDKDRGEIKNFKALKKRRRKK